MPDPVHPKSDLAKRLVIAFNTVLPEARNSPEAIHLAKEEVQRIMIEIDALHSAPQLPPAQTDPDNIEVDALHPDPQLPPAQEYPAQKVQPRKSSRGRSR